MNKIKVKKLLMLTTGCAYAIATTGLIHNANLDSQLKSKQIQAQTTQIQAYKQDIEKKNQTLTQEQKSVEKLLKEQQEYLKLKQELNKIKNIVQTENPKIGEDNAEHIAKSIKVFSTKYEVPEAEILAVIKTESNFNPRLEGDCQDRGLMQIIPSTEQEINKDLQLCNYDIFSIDTNIEMGTYYISKLKKRYNRYAYIVYNQGFSKPLNETTYDRNMSCRDSYIFKIMTRAEKYKEELL